MKSCFKCHSAEFKNPEDLKGMFNDIYPRGSFLEEVQYRLTTENSKDSMPRGENISQEEKESILKYLKDLKQDSE